MREGTIQVGIAVGRDISALQKRMVEQNAVSHMRTSTRLYEEIMEGVIAALHGYGMWHPTIGLYAMISNRTAPKLRLQRPSSLQH